MIIRVDRFIARFFGPIRLRFKRSTPLVQPMACLQVDDCLHALEPRFMFDAAGVAVGAEAAADAVAQTQAQRAIDALISDDGPAGSPDSIEHGASSGPDSSDKLLEALATFEPPSVRREIVFIDTTVEDYQTLIAEIDPGAEVVLLDADQDGVEQMASVLAVRTGVDAIHIVSHGNQAELQLGSARLTLDSMNSEYRDELLLIGQALTDDADLLIYGCNFGEGELGQDAAAQLAQKTGADVAASDDLTGNTSLGGDWELEFRTGQIETDIALSSAAQANWTGLLAEFTVTNTNDSGAGSLRAAIIAANSTPGADEINLPVGTYTLAGSGDDAAVTGDLDITDDLTITGAGAGVTIVDGGANDRVFEVHNGNTIVAITDLKIQNGQEDAGGGIRVRGGAFAATVALENVWLTGNTATDSIGNGGGAIFNQGILTVTNSLIEGNTANRGGGISNSSPFADLTLTNATLSGNDAISGDGGGLLSAANANATLTNVTITNNTATSSDGGGFATASPFGTNNFTNTIIAGNTVNSGSGPDLSGDFASGGFNIIGDTSGGATGFDPSDQLDTDPLLDSVLQDNGGPTPTHALLTGSPAINIGTSTGAPTDDQRGLPRDVSPDIGAFEFAASINNAPVAADDVATVAEDSANNTVDVLSNDTDVDGDTLTVSAVMQPANGLVVDNGDGTFNYTPNADFNGVDAFSYTVSDGNGGADTASVTVTVTSENDLPVAIGDSATTDEDTPVTTGNVLINDTDPDTDPLSVLSADLVSVNGGTVVNNGDGTFDYTPPLNFTGTDSFTYTVTDGNGGTATATVTLTVTPLNDAPGGVVGDLQLWLKADGGVTQSGRVSQWANQVVNATLPDVQQSTLAEQPLFNPSALNFNPVITFDGVNDDLSDTSVLGSDLFSPDAASIFTVARINRGVIVQWFDAFDNRVTVENDTPRFDFGDLNDDSVRGTGISSDYHVVTSQAVPGTPTDLAIYVDGELNAGPKDTENPLDPTQTGQLFLGQFPGGGFNAAIDLAEVIVYRSDLSAADRLQVESYLAVKYGITLDQTTPTNYVDSAGIVIWNAAANAGFNNDIAGIGRDNASSLSQTQSRSISSDAIVTLSAASSQDNGEFLLWGNDDGALTETSNGDPTGISQRIGRVWRAAETGEIGTTTVTFDLSGVTVSGTTASDFNLIIDTDTDFTSGATLVNADSFIGGVVTFTGVGLADGEFFALATKGNTVPMALDDSATVADDSVNNIVDVLSNDTDVDGDTLTVSAVAQPANGLVVDNGDGTFTYTPDAGFNGVDAFSYTVSDGNGGTDTASVTVTVTAANVPPVANADAATIDEGGTVTLDLAANDTDADDGLDRTSIDIASAPSRGSLVANTDGTVDYTHDGSENFSDSFSYRIRDISGASSNTANVSISVIPVNDNAPAITSPNGASVGENTRVVHQVTASDADLPGDSFGYSIAGAGADDALFIIDAGGNLGFLTTPDFEVPADADGDNVYTLDIVVSDGVNTTNQTVTVTVTAVNDNAPVITSPASATVVENSLAVGQVVVSDADLPGDGISYRLTGGGADDGLLTIDAGGNLSFLSAPDFEIPADADGDNVYVVEVAVTDGMNIINQTLTVTVAEANAPVLIAPIGNEVTEDPANIEQFDASDVTLVEVVAIGEGSAEPIEDQLDTNLTTALEELAPKVTQPEPADSGSEAGRDLTRERESEPVTIPWSISRSNLSTDILDGLRDTVLDSPTSPQPSPSIEPLEVSGFVQELDRLRTEIREDEDLSRIMVGSSVAVTTGLSIGYVVWLVRGAVLLSSMLSSLPAWRMVDPLPVLAHLGRRPKKDGDDQESLQTVIQKGAEVAELKRSKGRDG